MPYPSGVGLPQDHAEPSLIKPILRQWWLVGLFMLIGFGGAVAFIRTAQPRYTSFAKIYLPPSSGGVTEALGAVERANYLATQATVIQSSAILSKVAATPGLKEMHTFDKAHGQVIDFLRDELDVTLERKTDIIVISLESPYADEAATIVNTVVDAYTAYCQEERDTRSNKVLATLELQSNEKDRTSSELEDKIRDFRKKNPTVPMPNDATSTVLQELGMISQDYTRAQLASVEAKSTYAPNHPQVLRAIEREKGLKALYDEKLAMATQLNEKGADLQRLVSELDQSKQYSKEARERIQQLQLTMGGRKLIEVDVVEPAHVADEASFPRSNRTVAVSLVCGALLGAGLALLRDRMDGRMRSVEEMQTVIGLPILGVVPAMAGRRTAIARAMTVHLDPRSVVAEAYRTIRTAIFFGANGAQCKTMLVSSPESGDGKTTSASNLAIAIAQTGRTVLLLDADFRKPTQHKNLDIKDSIGLSSVLLGQETLERAIQHTGVEGLDILPCGPIPANPSEILNSREFADLIDVLAERYDHIIFDSPPVNLVTDARILGAICDATIIVLRADKSTRKAGEHARNAMLSVGARVLGAVVNDAPKRRGYDVYGGQYYGSGDYSYSTVPTTRRLSSDMPRQSDPAPQPQRRDIA